MKIILKYSFGSDDTHEDKQVDLSEFDNYQEFSKFLVEFINANLDVKYFYEDGIDNLSIDSDFRPFLNKFLYDISIDTEYDTDYTNIASYIVDNVLCNMDVRHDVLFTVHELLQEDSENAIFLAQFVTNVSMFMYTPEEIKSEIADIENRYLGVYSSCEDFCITYLNVLYPYDMTHYIMFDNYVKNNYDVLEVDNSLFVFDL